MTAPPDWFAAALATEPEQARIGVEGTPVAYRVWGAPSGRGIVLIHGGARAFPLVGSHRARCSRSNRQVIAVDLSGHGESSGRSGLRF